MPPKRRRDDARRQPDPPTSYEVETLVEFRERVLKTRNPTTGKPKIVLEYKVRWAGEWNDPKHDCWTKKENINVLCIREFDGDFSTVGERLATVPAALHPSHSGYATAMRMAAMSSQVVVIQKRAGPKRRQPAQGRRASTVAAPEGKQLGGSNEGDVDSNSNITNELTATTRGHQPAEGEDATRDDDDTEATAIVKVKRNFNEFTVIAVTRWVFCLDKIVAAGRARDPDFSSRHTSFFTKAQQEAHSVTEVAQWEEHRLEDGEDLFEMTSTGWSCNVCPDHVSVSRRADKIYKHILSQSHINEVKARASRRNAQSVASVSAAHGRLQAVPQMIRQGACIAAAQASLPFTAGSVMLAGL